MMPSMTSVVRALLALGVLLASTAVATAQQTVLVVKNSEHDRYEEPAQVIRARLGDRFTVRQLDLTDMHLDAAERNARALMQTKPVAVVALGDKAVFLANKAMAPAPVVFGMVSNWRDLQLDPQRVGGVSTHLEPETLMSQMKMFLPDRRRLGVIYGPASKAVVEAAMIKAARLGMTMIPVYIEQADEFPAVLDAIGGVLDLFWLVDDPLVATRDNIKALIETSTEQKLPTVCYSEGLVEAGITLAITADGTEVGTQLADTIGAIADGATGPMTIAPPAKARITVNRDHLRDFELTVDPMLLSFTRQVDTSTGRKARRP